MAGRGHQPSTKDLAARPWSAVEVRPGQPRSGDHGLVLPAARRVGRIEPLCEELTQPRLTGTALHRQPLVEGGFELRLADAGPAVYLLQLLQHPVEVDRPEDLAQRDIGGPWPVIGV